MRTSFAFIGRARGNDAVRVHHAPGVATDAARRYYARGCQYHPGPVALRGNDTRFGNNTAQFSEVYIVAVTVQPAGIIQCSLD